MKTLLLALLCSLPLVGQRATMIDSSCAAEVNLTWTWSAPRPFGRTVTLYVDSLRPGDFVFMFYGFSTDQTFSIAQIPLPMDMGNLLAPMSGCYLLTSATGATFRVASATTAAFTYDISFSSPPLVFQVLHQSINAPGINLSHGLLYTP